MTSLKRVMKKELEIIQSKPAGEDLMKLEFLYFDKEGKISRKPSRGIPEPRPKPLVEGEGASYENGIPVIPKKDKKLRKRGKTP